MCGPCTRNKVRLPNQQPIPSTAPHRLPAAPAKLTPPRTNKMTAERSDGLGPACEAAQGRPSKCVWAKHPHEMPQTCAWYMPCMLCTCGCELPTGPAGPAPSDAMQCNATTQPQCNHPAPNSLSQCTSDQLTFTPRRPSPERSRPDSEVAPACRSGSGSSRRMHSTQMGKPAALVRRRSGCSPGRLSRVDPQIRS